LAVKVNGNRGAQQQISISTLSIFMDMIVEIQVTRLLTTSHEVLLPLDIPLVGTRGANRQHFNCTVSVFWKNNR